MLGRLLQAIDALFVTGSLKVVTFQGFFLCFFNVQKFWMSFGCVSSTVLPLN